MAANEGLSPRARGKLGAIAARVGMIGPIPASAGETLSYNIDIDFQGAYPRERGGNQGSKLPAHSAGGLSPRARGKRARIWARI
ncbi:hypothetical protein NTGHW29_150002 [Candidatus Nitrotoga sp. HW29]|nr:hypothetical protein NTGHW29_150002 [Candidatus Nitrotoga sp. HW29]